MKQSYRLLSIVLITSITLIWGCGGDETKTPVEKTALKKLAKTWSITSSSGAALDGTDRTADFSNFKITISGSFDSGSPDGPYTFSVAGSRPDPSPWPASGTWTFDFVDDSSGNSGGITRDDGVAMLYSIDSSGKLTLAFTCSSCDYAGARTSQVNGNWTFNMN